MTLPKKLVLQVWAPKIEGEGANLSVQFEAVQQTKKGGRHRTVLVLDVDRSFVRGLCIQIAEMQVRDQERIARELQRLQYEVAPLGVKPP